MGVCFLCDAKLFGERTRVCSSITPHSNVPYPEKIVELMGEEFVVIITPADHMCKKCTSLLVHMDKLENDLKLVKNAMLSYIQKKYGILPPDQPVKSLDIVNGHLKTDELEVGQRKIPSGLTTVRENPPVHTPLKMIKPQDSSPKLKIYKCGFCTFQSKELGHVRFHMRTHMNKKENEKPIIPPVTSKTQAAPPPQLQTQKKRLYRCQVCSLSFDSRINCLDHIQKDHNQPSLSTNEDKEETEDVASKPEETLKTPEENPQTESTINEDEGQQDNGTVDTNMLLNNNVSAAVEEQEPTNAEEESTQETAAVPDVLPAQEEDPITEGEKLNDTEIAANGRETKTGDLDIESMLAAIHHDNSPTNTGTPQSLV